MKKRYIRPDAEIIIANVEQQLLAGTQFDTHGGGNPGKTDPEPSSAKPVGTVGYVWSDEEDEKSGSQNNLWK